MKLSSRLLMVFGLNFCEKPQIWVSKPHFWEVPGDARPWLMARWKAHNRLASLNFCAIYYTVPELLSEMFTVRLFLQGVDLFALKIITSTGSCPSTILGIRKLETLRYPLMKIASL